MREALDRRSPRPRSGARPVRVAALDAGCGRVSALRQFRPRVARMVGADIHEPAAPLPHLDEFAIVDLCGPADAFPAASASTSCCRTSRSSTSPIRRRRWPTSGAGCGPAARWSRPRSIGATRSWRPIWACRTARATRSSRWSRPPRPTPTRWSGRATTRRPSAGTGRRRLHRRPPADGRPSRPGLGPPLPTFALGLVGDVLTSAHPVASLDDRRRRRTRRTTLR